MGVLGLPGNVFWKGLIKNGIVKNYVLRSGGEVWHQRPRVGPRFPAKTPGMRQ